MKLMPFSFHINVNFAETTFVTKFLYLVQWSNISKDNDLVISVTATKIAVTAGRNSLNKRFSFFEIQLIRLKSLESCEEMSENPWNLFKNITQFFSDIRYV